MPPKSKGKPRGKPFEKGDKRAGRPKGTPNKATIEVREVTQQIVEDPVYRERLARRAKNGDLPPAVECMLWYYAYGKPKERVEHAGPDGGPIDVRNAPGVTTAEARDELAALLAEARRGRVGAPDDDAAGDPE